MTLQRLSGLPGQKPIAFAPTQDGPATTITFPNNAPGWRRIVAAEGDLSGVQSDTIKYLLEITAANGTTSGVVRTVKLYTYNVETNVLTYLHTITGLPNSNTPGVDYAEAFWVNVAGGYYTFELNQNLYVMGLADGAIWGNSGAIGSQGLSNTPFYWAVVPHPANLAVFNLIYYASPTTGSTTHRQVTVNTVAKTVNWGSATSYAYSSASFSGKAIPDTRGAATAGNWIIGRVFTNSTASGTGINPLILNPTTGVMTVATYAPVNAGYSYGFYGGVSFLQGDNCITNPLNSTNMTMYSTNPWVNGSYAALPTWGAAALTIGGASCVAYFDPDGKFGKYVLYTDQNMDVWFTKVAFNSIGAGSFGTTLFRASTTVTGLTSSGTDITSSKPLTPCKYGFFYVGQMNTTTTAAPVIWYPLKPNLP